MNLTYSLREPDQGYVRYALFMPESPPMSPLPIIRPPVVFVQKSDASFSSKGEMRCLLCCSEDRGRQLAAAEKGVESVTAGFVAALEVSTKHS